ncbi:MAG: hypothetical protein KatS3mg132_269 [Limisphaera sp.]|nr:MAG: hypothetical protein KatS3mg132_269 [Limisphaera sp.]
MTPRLNPTGPQSQEPAAPAGDQLPPVPMDEPVADVSPVLPPETPEPAPAAAAPAVPEHLKFSPAALELIKLARAAVPESVMLAYVTNSTRTFNLGADQIVYLNDLGVSSEVIRAMIEQDRRLRELGGQLPAPHGPGPRHKARDPARASGIAPGPSSPPRRSSFRPTTNAPAEARPRNHRRRAHRRTPTSPTSTFTRRFRPTAPGSTWTATATAGNQAWSFSSPDGDPTATAVAGSTPITVGTGIPTTPGAGPRSITVVGSCTPAGAGAGGRTPFGLRPGSRGDITRATAVGRPCHPTAISPGSVSPTAATASDGVGSPSSRGAISMIATRIGIG